MKRPYWLQVASAVESSKVAWRFLAFTRSRLAASWLPTDIVIVPVPAETQRDLTVSLFSRNLATVICAVLGLSIAAHGFGTRAGTMSRGGSGVAVGVGVGVGSGPSPTTTRPSSPRWAMHTNV